LFIIAFSPCTCYPANLQTTRSQCVCTLQSSVICQHSVCVCVCVGARARACACVLQMMLTATNCYFTNSALASWSSQDNQSVFLKCLLNLHINYFYSCKRLAMFSTVHIQFDTFYCSNKCTTNLYIRLNNKKCEKCRDLSPARHRGCPGSISN
jgi:hypothetical protein